MSEKHNRFNLNVVEGRLIDWGTGDSVSLTYSTPVTKTLKMALLYSGVPVIDDSLTESLCEQDQDLLF